MAYNLLLLSTRYHISSHHFGPNWSQLALGMAESKHALGGSREHPELGGAMQYSKPLIVDYGPNFFGHSFLVDKGIVCVIPHQLTARSSGAAAMREAVQSIGGECGGCRNCPLGLAG